MNVLVSVIIPTHNRAHLLMRAVKSVLNQTLQDFEIIIVNDASTDNTTDVLHNLRKFDTRIKTISNQMALGGGKTRNVGIHASKGKWIAFLDDDDIWHPQKLEFQLQELAIFPNAVACSTGYTIHYPLRIKKNIFTPSQISLPNLLKSNSLGGSSVCLCAADIAKNIHGFDEKLRSSQDWDFWVRLRMQGNIISIHQPLVQYQVHFNYRISNDMRSKYSGARLFYFKHKHLMNNEARIMNLSFICFIQSRQGHRKLSARVKKLFIAVRHSHLRTSISYMLSSLPRMI